jgi:Protein of unknown function (DUF2778)
MSPTDIATCLARSFADEGYLARFFHSIRHLRRRIPDGKTIFSLGARGMSFISTDWRSGAGDGDYRRLVPNSRAQRMLASAALGCVALACGWTLWVNLAGPHSDQIFSDQVEVAGTRGDKVVSARDDSVVSTRGDKLVASTARSRVAAAATAVNNFVSLFDPHYFSGSSPGTFARTAALQSDGPPAQPATQQAQTSSTTAPTTRSIVESAASPVPPLRLTDNRNASVRANRAAAAAVATPDQQPTIFERLFGKSSPLTLAYAAPDDGGLAVGSNIASARFDSETAVYDISAHVVYMPDGTRLEAHSGYGSLLDDPHHPEAKNRGVTPPDLYDLTLREAPFHGVRALRLNPVDESKVYGRSGLLAHTFMLGPNGDSNGCVSFRNYDAFLQAYLKHQIKKLAVVARLD